MEDIEYYVGFLTNTHLMIAPILFILLHGLRSILLIPVIVICIAGGLIFGVIPGIILSIIGLLFSSSLFFYFAEKIPFITKRLSKMKDKIINRDTPITTSQIMILRMFPFINYHLLSFLIYESSEDFRTYMISSFYTIIPMAVVYTSIGQTVTSFPPIVSLGLLVGLVGLLFVVRKKTDNITVEEFLR